VSVSYTEHRGDRAARNSRNQAVYVVATDRKGERQCFRIGVPTELSNAHDRWDRIDSARRMGKARVRFNRRWYSVDQVEVRAVDRHGRGLGSLRHGLAFTVPCAALKVG